VCPATLGTSHVWENRICSNCGISQDQAIVSASLTLQSHWRGKKARKAYKGLKNEFRERQEVIDREKKREEKEDKKKEEKEKKLSSV